ncbi:hypothetical protein [uncultured Aquimarina sp.]|uniref:hypothetical protein n=1 Tax=uncultured Aquimarina sp. TaxID=575652 RepID=UPI002602DAFC|nr:hypothetical protein [uncultured Aquimarina sp.]
MSKNSTISTQIISASLTMITVIGAFAVFIIEKREIGPWYYLTAGSAFLCFVLSIFLGGQGLSGKGKNKSPNPYFNWQAITALIGVVLFCISVFFGKEKPDNLKNTVHEQEKVIIELKTKDTFRERDIERINQELNDLKKELKKIKND